MPWAAAGAVLNFTTGWIGREPAVAAYALEGVSGFAPFDDSSSGLADGISVALGYLSASFSIGIWR